MNKPWEEEWTYEPPDQELPIALVEAEGWNYPFGNMNALPAGVIELHSQETHNARARLAAAAPDMARVLLAIEWEGHLGLCPVCDGRRPECEGEGHRAGCAWVAALRKAGALRP